MQIVDEGLHAVEKRISPEPPAGPLTTEPREAALCGHRRPPSCGPRSGSATCRPTTDDDVRHAFCDYGATVVPSQFSGNASYVPTGATCRTPPTTPASWYGIRRSKTDQEGTATDVRCYLKNGCAVALRQLRDRITVQRSGLCPGRHRAGARRLGRPIDCAPPHRRGQGGRYRRADHRPLRTRRSRQRVDGARRLHHRDDACRRLETARMVAHYSAAATAEQQGAVAKYL